MITKTQLIAAQYREHFHNEPFTSNKMYQKCVRGADRNIRCYYINVYIWCWPTGDTSVSCGARLYLPEGNALVGSTGFDVNLSVTPDTTIECIEDFFGNTYVQLNCVPDLHNQD